MLVIMDGSGFVCLPASQDHKRAYDGDEGPNTGGMGAYCPAPVVTDEIKSRVVEKLLHQCTNICHLLILHIVVCCMLAS